MKRTAAILIITVVVLFYIVRHNRTVSMARKYLGKTEKASGTYEWGFADSRLEQKLRSAGWQQGQDWCAYFVKSIVLETLPSYKRHVIEKLMNGSTQHNYKQLLKASGYLPWIKIYTRPVRGSIATWQRTSDPAHGHTGIVIASAGNTFTTIEGNVRTTARLDGVAKRKHSLAERHNTAGLRLLPYFIKIV